MEIFYSFKSRRLYVLREVKKPVPTSWIRPPRRSEGVAMAGAFSERAAPDHT
jgi:hypothetical protein